MAMSKTRVSTDTLLLAAAVDRLSLLVYANTKDAEHKRNAPKSIVDALTATREQRNKDHLTFSSGAEFEAARAKLLENLKEEV